MKGHRDIAGDGGSNIVGQVAAQQARLAARMASIRASVAVVSGKGGVGKSSVTANLAAALAARGLAVGVLDADLNGPSLGKMLGVRGQTLRVEAAGVRPAVSAEGIRVLSMDLLLPGDDTPVVWDAPTQAEAHTWRGTMEGTALREFLMDTAWGALDVLLIDLPPGADRLPTLLDLLPGLTGAVVVTIPSAVSHLVVRRAMTLARERGARLLGLVENMAGLRVPELRDGRPPVRGRGRGDDGRAARRAVPGAGPLRSAARRVRGPRPALRSRPRRDAGRSGPDRNRRRARPGRAARARAASRR